MPADIQLVTVFPAGPGGGNPAPIVLDADALSDADMQALAREYGEESSFVLASDDPACAFALRFWVPEHEMTMCGHATVGTVWLLDRLGRLPADTLTVATRSGPVRARIAGAQRSVEISQPAGTSEVVAEELVPAVLDALGLTTADLAPRPLRNARTSRTKTLVPLAEVAVLDALSPRFDRMIEVCDALGSTGLYPYAVSDADHQVFDARQFPRSSGYPEDAATGIAAAALSFGLVADGLISTDRPVRVRQGRAMGRPSEIRLRFDDASGGIWLGGRVSPGGR